jgi:hypothetical protein
MGIYNKFVREEEVGSPNPQRDGVKIRQNKKKQKRKRTERKKNKRLEN